jgi:hypothetical protein
MGTKNHRLRKEEYTGQVCASFTLCLHNRVVFFIHPATVRPFVTFLEKIAHKHAFRAIYCFMPDHLHLVFLGNSDGTDLLLAVGQFKSHWALAKPEPCRHPLAKKLLRSGLRTDEVRLQIGYVLDNPVRRNLVDDWRKYPFTGAVGLNLEEFLERL